MFICLLSNIYIINYSILINIINVLIILYVYNYLFNLYIILLINIKHKFKFIINEILNTNIYKS